MKYIYVELLEIIPVLLHFFICFFYSQAIYRSKHFLKIIAFFFAIPFIFYLPSQYSPKPVQFLAMTFVFSAYGLLLLLIKLYYKKIHRFLRRKKWIHYPYTDKDFTFVTSSEGSGDTWDEKKELRPYWLDHLFSFCLIGFPILMAAGVYQLIKPG